jgi:hypothetical protein
MFEPPLPAESRADLPADAPPPDPYDGVALGVECAWPREATEGAIG